MAMFLEREGFGYTYPLDSSKDKIVIGRSLACDLQFTSPHISRQHCEITRLRPLGTLIIKNLKDTNVTYVEDCELRSVTDYVEFRPGSTIGLGVPLSEERTNVNFVFLRLRKESIETSHPKIDDQKASVISSSHDQQEETSAFSAKQDKLRRHELDKQSAAQTSAQEIIAVHDISEEENQFIKTQHRKANSRRASQDGSSSPSNQRTRASFGNQTVSRAQTPEQTPKSVQQRRHSDRSQVLRTLSPAQSPNQIHQRRRSDPHQVACQVIAGDKAPHATQSKILSDNRQSSCNVEEPLTLTKQVPLERNFSERTTESLDMSCDVVQYQPRVSQDLLKAKRVSEGFSPSLTSGHAAWHETLANNNANVENRSKLSLSHRDKFAHNHINSDNVSKVALKHPKQSAPQLLEAVPEAGEPSEIEKDSDKLSKSSLSGPALKPIEAYPVIEIDDDANSPESVDLTQPDPENVVENCHNIDKNEVSSDQEQTSSGKTGKAVGKRKRSTAETNISDQEQDESEEKKPELVKSKSVFQGLLSESDSDSVLNQLDQSTRKKSKSVKLKSARQVVSKDSKSDSNCAFDEERDESETKKSKSMKSLNVREDVPQDSDSDSDSILCAPKHINKKKRRCVVFSDSENESSGDSENESNCELDEDDTPIISLKSLVHKLTNRKCTIPMNRLSSRILSGARKGKAIIVDEDNELELASPMRVNSRISPLKKEPVVDLEETRTIIHDYNLFDDDELPDLSASSATLRVEPLASSSLESGKGKPSKAQVKEQSIGKHKGKTVCQNNTGKIEKVSLKNVLVSNFEKTSLESAGKNEYNLLSAGEREKISTDKKSEKNNKNPPSSDNTNIASTSFSVKERNKRKNVEDSAESGNDGDILPKLKLKRVMKKEDATNRASTSFSITKGNKRENAGLSSVSNEDSFPKLKLKRSVEKDDVGEVKVKLEKTDDEIDRTKTTAKKSAVEEITPVVIKKEPTDKKDEQASGMEDDEDADDVIFMYSQADETIWVSSDEEETPSQENMSFGPLPPSPDLDIAQLFEEHESDKGSEEGKSSELDKGETADDDDEDQWFPILSQAFWDDDDFMKPADKEVKKVDGKAPVIDSVPGPSGLNATSKSSHSDDSNTSTWWPILSQDFDDDDDDDNVDATDSSTAEGEAKAQPEQTKLNVVIEKLKSRDARKSQLIDPKAPLPRTKNDTLRKRSRTLSDPSELQLKGHSKKPLEEKGKSKERGDINNKELRSKEKNIRNKSLLTPPPSKLRKGGKKSPSLRDNLSSKYNLDSYKAIAKQKPTEKSHLQNVSEKPPPPKRSHLISDKPRSDENISIQRKTSQKENKEQSRPKVAAKVTTKTRAEKLTDVNLFPSPQLPVTKPRKPKYTIPKKSNTSSKVDALFGDDNESTVSAKDSRVLRHSRKVIVAPHVPNHVETSHSSVTSTVSSTTQSSVPSQPNQSVNQVEDCVQATSSNQKDETANGGQTNNSVQEENARIDDCTDNKESEIAGESVKGILKVVNDRKTAKKKVHFPSINEELNRVLFISPRKNKEKSGSLEARLKEVLPKELVLEKHHIPANYAEHFIHHICRWNYDWLETYRAGQEKQETSGKGGHVQPPPVVSSTNYPTLILYESYRDYKEIFSNLMYLEIWENVYKDWLKYRHSNMWLPTLVDLIQPSYIQTRQAAPLKSWRVKLITLITVEQSNRGQHPRQGSLVGLRISEGRKRVHFFAYVEQFTKLKKRMICKELQQACPHGEVCIMMEVRIAKDGIQELQSGKIITISNVSYIRPCTRTWEGLCKLPLSPLCSDILSPNKEAFMSNHSGKYLVDGMPLNESQINAVVQVGNKCVFDKQVPKLSLIHGPPGTGKTRTIIAGIAQIIKLCGEHRLPNCRILLCAPSNAAVDELTLRLMRLREISIPLRVVRVGMRDSISAEVKKCSLETLVAKHINREIAAPKNVSTRKEWERRKSMVDQATRNLEKALKENKSKDVIKPIEMRLHELVRSKTEFERSFSTKPTPQEHHILQQKWQREILLGAEVITTTLGGCCSGVMADIFIQHSQTFTCCIVDEAGQCKETETWLPLLLGVRKLVLVGDHRQLPATVLSQLAQDKNLKQSLFERLYHRFVVELQLEDLVHTLNVQYRMHPEIALWPSAHFYFNKLETNPDIVQHRSYDFKPYILFDLKNSHEQRGPNNEIYNVTEACAVRQIIESLEPYIANQKIGIVTPYQRQKYLLEEKLAKFFGRLQIVVNTIDGFQGQERDIIILSFVRANTNANIGFLSQRQRLNVALTRARKSCYVVASLSSLSGNKDWQSLIADAKARGLVYSVSDTEVNSKEYFKSVLRR